MHFPSSHGAAFCTLAFLLTGPGSGQVQQVVKLNPIDGGTNDLFGFSVGVSGHTAVVGARHDDPSGPLSGSAYVFTRIAGLWTEQAKLLASDGEASDSFGRHVALDGDTMLLSAHGDDDNGVGAGAAYVFRLIQDDDIPAVSGIGAVLLLLAMLGTGAYLLRR